MKLIVLTGLNDTTKSLLTADLARHFTSAGQRVVVMDNANVAPDLDGISAQVVPMRGGCACCAVAGKLYRTAADIGPDVDVAILPTNSQTHVDNLATVLDNLVAGSHFPVTVTTVALVDERTLCCFPYVGETMRDYADLTLGEPFALEDVLAVVG